MQSFRSSKRRDDLNIFKKQKILGKINFFI